MFLPPQSSALPGLAGLTFSASAVSFSALAGLNSPWRGAVRADSRRSMDRPECLRGCRSSPWTGGNRSFRGTRASTSVSCTRCRLILCLGHSMPKSSKNLYGRRWHVQRHISTQYGVYTVLQSAVVVVQRQICATDLRSPRLLHLIVARPCAKRVAYEDRGSHIVTGLRHLWE